MTKLLASPNLRRMNANQIIDTLGGTAAVARMFKIKQPSVSEWRKTGIPSARLQLLEVVRPDIFGAPPTGHRQEVSDA
ncbi:hypothetical protein SAMN05660380_02277, partial [Xylella fastidiosa]